MSRTNGILGLYTETSLHPGTGQNVGSIDLPVRREKHTRFPFIPSSSLKGAFRNVEYSEDYKEILFGAELGSAKHFAGALSVSDARLLLFPVRSIRYGFVWVTTPFVLHRLSRDLRLLGLDAPEFFTSEVVNGTAIVGEKLASKDSIILEDMMLTTKTDDHLSDIAKKVGSLCLKGEANKPMLDLLLEKLVIVSMNDFVHLVQYGTEVVARNQLNESKISKNLWYVELIPRDSVFYVVVSAEDSMHAENHSSADLFSTFKAAFDSKYVQIGGHETLGQGWCLSTVNSEDDLITFLGESSREE
ncbi:MAG: type III-B CRISPR module RAMP protein Cmr4 [Candidatus Thorarchaeota archaeon]|nr:type III-B CRISPR module RAMP protein Cmr4 [Candidatus Thorarchaeota archaeon]